MEVLLGILAGLRLLGLSLSKLRLVFGLLSLPQGLLFGLDLRADLGYGLLFRVNDEATGRDCRIALYSASRKVEDGCQQYRCHAAGSYLVTGRWVSLVPT